MNTPARTSTPSDPGSPTVDPEESLLDSNIENALDGHTTHGLENAPVFTNDALQAAGEGAFGQRALYGQILEQVSPGFPAVPRSRKVYINTNAPFSAIVCGVQGSGKSHATAVLLESSLIADSRLGTLPEPLDTIIFRYDAAAGGGAVDPCEAAYLATLDTVRGEGASPPWVTVLVLPSSLRTMQQVYSKISNVDVKPLRFAANDITAARLLAMMKADEEAGLPLYMEAIMDILRSMDSTFQYTTFKRELDLRSKDFAQNQKSMLRLRLSLLDSCLKDGSAKNRIANYFGQGRVTIIDLSSPFMDTSSACGLFDIILGIFIENKSHTTGKVIVLDEAHKYLSSNSGSMRLTDSLLTVVRQQRHSGTRVIISTQEPTVVPAPFLELCSFVIAHRFASPTWLQHLQRHVAAVPSNDEVLSTITTLRTGESLLFASAGVGVKTPCVGLDGTDSVSSVQSRLAPFGKGYLHVRSRQRVTKDGGASVLASSHCS